MTKIVVKDDKVVEIKSLPQPNFQNTRTRFTIDLTSPSNSRTATYGLV
ncbi:hypothetical protein N9B94_00990 [Verrucomicrobia bacterium]|nr:hypothetical protein [Verrucomicrobiota bacterium]